MTYLQIAQALRSPIARDRVMVALLVSANAILEETPPSADPELSEHNKKVAFAKIITTEPILTADRFLVHLMKNPTIQAKAVELVSDTLDEEVETDLDTDIQTVIDDSLPLFY